MTDEQRRGSWIQTYTGRAFWPLDPRSEEVHEDDISHALAQICRFGGHTKFFYSVAEHCVLVSEWVESVAGPYDALWGLLHDAPEAYIGDMVRPIKRLLPKYIEADENLLEVICYKWGLEPGMPEVVREADNRILLDERNKLFNGVPPRPWVQDEQGLVPLGVTVGCWTPARAKSEYMIRLNNLARSLSR